MIVGNVAAFGGTLINPAFREQWWPLAGLHVALNIGLTRHGAGRRASPRRVRIKRRRPRLRRRPVRPQVSRQPSDPHGTLTVPIALRRGLTESSTCAWTLYTDAICAADPAAKQTIRRAS